MLGAIAGDIIGSVYEYEWNNIKSKEFDLFSQKSFFTDDSVLTIALADAILHGNDYGQVMRRYYRRYPNAGYGRSFHRWASIPDTGPYNSWGNGSAMRTSPVGYAFDNLDEVLWKAAHYASFTHNHPEGIKGAQAIAASIFLARNGASKAEIESFVVQWFDYDLSQSLSEIRPNYRFDESCQGTVPQALTAFIESVSYEDAIRNAISIGGDSDTLGCIAGGIAEAFYGGVPKNIKEAAKRILDRDLRMVVDSFYHEYINHI
uniref:ADP-ribosylglycohydrolase n=1 Tax=Candidatus Kentrum sp. TUN TaxID=2126343 RepID=A0A450ZTT9_9GAMM|nr:MAG: ADP-ribosylglycohydrolase [Candidatus Kentron sp. TUN]VFK65203.1 MAG: ADP-ribosylglycohydrolase [Candidatus Kentron sp. TUN]